MNALFGPTLVTLGNVLLLFCCAAYVGRCRLRFGVKAPATTGHPEFEVAYRIQMNTLENTVLFLPVLWICALYLSTVWATVLGVSWLLGRVWYAFAYAREPRTRGGGFLLAMISFGGLGLGGAWGVLRGMLA